MGEVTLSAAVRSNLLSLQATTGLINRTQGRLADLNEEGANLLALQTRQQLGIQSLAFAGQSEQSILGLFR